VYVYDINKKEVSFRRSAFLTAFIGFIFALLISYLCGPLYGVVTAIAVSLLSIKILVFHDAETIKERIWDSIVTAFAIGILVGVTASILAVIIHGFLAGKESIHCDGSWEFLAGGLAFSATFLFIIYRGATAATYDIYNIYREE